MSLEGKTVALVCPKFYGYEDYIANELQGRGATVYLIYENLEWVKLSYRIVYVYRPKQKPKLQQKYYEKKLQDIAAKLDYFIVIRGSSLNSVIMTWVRNKTPKHCRYIMYQWDGVKNNQVALDVSSFFDRVSTFDQEDSEKYGWVYRPLFFLPQFAKKDQKKDIDILFICALHSNRARILNQLKRIAVDRDYTLKTVLHLNRFLFFKYKYLDKKDEVVDADDNDITFKPLSIEESYSLYSRSKVVVDYTNVNQTGFTMRTIEALGNGCKLITNNDRIRNADFYKEENIYIYEEAGFMIPDGFLLSQFEPISESVYDRYSLKSWVNDLIGDWK